MYIYRSFPIQLVKEGFYATRNARFLTTALNMKYPNRQNEF